MEKPPETPAAPAADPLLDAVTAALVEHGSPQGYIDYVQMGSVFARLIAEVVGPQDPRVRQDMLRDFRKALDVEVQRCALRHSVINGGKS